MKIYELLTTIALSGFAVSGYGQDPAANLEQLVYRAQSHVKSFEYFQSIRICKDVVATVEKIRPSIREEQILCFYVLADSFQALRDPLAAEHALNRALEIQQESPGEIHIDAAETLERLANVYAQKRENGKYIPTMRRAISIREAYVSKLKSENTLEGEGVAKELVAIAEDVRYAPYENLMAEELYGRALEIRRKVLGSNHVDVAKTIERIAYLNFDQHKLDEAEAGYIEAYNIRTKSSGVDDPGALENQKMLAHVYAQKRDYGRAIKLSQHVLESKERVFGADSLELTTSLDQLAAFNLSNAKSLRSVKRTVQLRERALSIFRKAFGDYHPLVEDALVSLEITYMALGDESRLIEIREQRSKILLGLIGMLESELGENSLSVAYYKAKWAYLNSDADHERVESYLQSVISIRERSLGKENSLVTEGLENLRKFHKKIGQQKE